MVDTARPRRWPAYALAVLFLGYATGKVTFAVQGRLGFPGGPAVPAAEHDRYARDFIDVATAQWLAAGSGLLAACLAIATVTAWGRRAPRIPMLLLLAGMLVAVGGGAGVMIVDGFVGVGVGWQWYHGLVGVAVIALVLATIRSYALATRRRAPA